MAYDNIMHDLFDTWRNMMIWGEIDTQNVFKHSVLTLQYLIYTLHLSSIIESYNDYN